VCRRRRQPGSTPTANRAAGADEQDLGVEQFRLPRFAHFRKEEMTAVARQLVGELAIGDPRMTGALPPAEAA
jgi:hypothetical protein